MIAGLGVAGTTSAARASKLVAQALNQRLTLITGAGGNIVVLNGPAGLLLVDSGAPGSTSPVQAALRGIARGARVTTVINTHWHLEQTGGNEVFGKAGATLIAHAKAAQRMRVDQYLPSEDRYLPARRKAALPSKVFYLGSQSLQFAAEHIDYGHLLEAHTDGDLYVHFRDSNVLVVGDAAAPQLDPQLAWYEGGWLGGRIDAQTRLLALASGGVISRAELEVERSAMEQLFTRMSEAMRKGLTTEDMQKAKLLDGLPRTWANPDKFIYDAHKGMWAHHNKLSHQVV
jgi:cyclase